MKHRLHARQLGVWMNGVRVGTWGLNSHGAQTFSYDFDWLNSPGARPLSLWRWLLRAKIDTIIGMLFI